MHIQLPKTILTLLGLAPVFTSAQNVTNPPSVHLNFNCSVFSPANGRQYMLNYTEPSNDPIRVSRADICPSDADAERLRSCRVSARGQINVTATTNATDIPDASVLNAMLHQSLRQQGLRSSEITRYQTALTKEMFNQSATSFPIPRGEAVYTAFTPNMTCFEGVVSTNDTCSTSDEGIRNVKEKFEGRALRICAPRLYLVGPAKRRNERVAGTVGVVKVSLQEAEREEMKLNPALPNSTPDDHYEVGNAKPTGIEGVGGGEGLRMRWGSLGGAVLLAVGMVGWM